MGTTRGKRRWCLAATWFGLALMAVPAMSGCAGGAGEDDTVAGISTTAGEQPPASVPAREALVAGVMDDTNTDLLLDPDTEITRVEADYLSEWVLLRVENNTYDHGVVMHVLHGGDSQTWTVTGHPEVFDTIVEDDMAGVADADMAVQLVRTRLDATRPTRGIGRVVEGVDDVDFPENLDPSEEARRDEAVAELDDAITPPTVEDAAGGGWIVTLYVHRMCESTDAVARVTRDVAEVQPTGVVDERSEPVAGDLPGPSCIP